MPDADAAIVPEPPPVKRGPGRPRKYPVEQAAADPSSVPAPDDCDPISPAAFAERFFGNNPNLLQVLESYPNKEVQAATLFRVGYQAYLYAMLVEVPRLTDAWKNPEAAVAEIRKGR